MPVCTPVFQSENTVSLMRFSQLCTEACRYICVSRFLSMSWKLAAASGKAKLVVRAVEANEAAVLYCAGQLCLPHEAARFGQVVRKFLNSRKNIVLELSAVEAIDSAGLGELVLLSMQARAAECEVRLAATSEDLLNLLRY